MGTEGFEPTFFIACKTDDLPLIYAPMTCIFDHSSVYNINRKPSIDIP